MRKVCEELRIKIEMYVSGAGVATTPETPPYLDYLLVVFHAVGKASHDGQSFRIGHVFGVPKAHQLVD